MNAQPKKPCQSCTLPAPMDATLCPWCGAGLLGMEWHTARNSHDLAKNLAMANSVATSGDKNAARNIVAEQLEIGKISRLLAHPALESIERAQTWRDLEAAVALALGASALPPANSWVVVAPEKTSTSNSHAKNQPREKKTFVVAFGILACASILITGVGAWMLTRDDDNNNLATSSSSTTSSVPSGSTLPGGSGSAPPVTGTGPNTIAPDNSLPNSSPSTPGGPTQPTPPPLPQGPANSATSSAETSEDGKQRLQRTIETVNEIVEIVDSKVANLEDQTYSRLPNFYDCYPTQDDPLPLDPTESQSSYARANAQFYSSFITGLDLSQIELVAIQELVAAQFAIENANSRIASVIEFVASKSGVSVSVQFQYPSPTDPLVRNRFFATGLDRCTKVR